MERPNRKDYINKSTKVQLIADLEMYINYLESKSDGVTLPLTDRAKEKLNYINGSGISRYFPDQEPTKQWVGAVLDLLEELKLDNLIT
jgi:hypothetical protein